MKIGRLVALGSLASLGPVVEFASRFGRTIILSHGLSPTEFGAGAALTLVIAIAELATDIGLDRFLILRADKQEEALTAVHGLSLMRGAFLAVLVFIAAPWIAAFLGAADSEGSFRAIAGVIFLHSCVHLETKQIQRNFSYGPDTMTQIAEHSLAFLSVYPAVSFFGDHRAAVVMLFAQSAGYVGASHLVARQRYRATLRGGAIAREALRYGLPLSLNGMGLAAMGQLDRVVISHWLGIEMLARYTVILNFTIIPISAIYRILAQLGMSFLGQHRDEPGRLLDLYVTFIWAYAVVAGFYALFVAATADLLVPVLFGAIYQIPPLFQALVTMIVWIRICRGAQTLMLLFSGDTARLTFSNLVACVWPVFAFPLFLAAPGVEAVLTAILLSDMLSLASFVAVTRRQLPGRWQLRLRDLLWSGSAVLIACAGIIVPGSAPATRWIAVGLSFALLSGQLVHGGRKLLRPSTRSVQP